MGFNLDILFIIVFMEESNIRYLISCEIDKKIAFMPLDKFFNYLGYIKKIQSSNYLK